jgi:hypothetical protein
MVDQDLFIFRRLGDARVQAYYEDGYVLAGRTLTDRGLELIREQCMEAWHAEKGEFDPNKTWLQNALLVNVHRRSEAVRRYYFHGPLVDIAEQLIGPNIKGALSQLSFKVRGNTKQFGWHQDNGYGELEPSNAITCLTALDDATLENGCLWVVPDSHRQGQVAAHVTAEDKASGKEVSVEADESKAIPVPMKAGECLIFHGWMLHRSGGNMSDHDRRMLFVRYADADAVEVYNERKPRLGRLLRGRTRFPEVEAFEADLD